MPYVGPAPTPNAPKDLQGGELKLDADADTTITADTDDQIDIKVAGSDEIKITSAMLAPASADGSALGGTSNEWSDLYLADSGIIYFGADQDVTLTHVADTGVLLSSTDQLQFGDSASYIAQSSDGVLRIDGEATIDLNASTAVTVSNDLKLDSDAAVLGFGADNDVTLTHVADTGVLLNSTMAIQFNDASQYINAPSNAILDINATDEIELNATLADVNANLDVSGTLTVGGVTTLNGNFLIDGSNNDLMTFRTTGDTASQVLGLQFQNNSEEITAQIFGTGDNSSSGVFRIKGIGDVAIVGGEIGVDGNAGDLVVKSGGDVHVGTGDLIFATAGKGVNLGVTSNTDANTLDDYEEGSWTPAQNGVTAAAASGVYTKVGRMVYAFFTMTTATTSDASSMQVSGLPFACASIDGSCAKGYDNYEATNNSHAYVPNGQSYVQFTQNTTGASTNAVHTGKLLKICAIYQAAT